MVNGEPSLEAAKRLFDEGLAALRGGRFEEAERAFVASLAAAPGRAPTLLNLATTRLQLQRPAEAIAAADAVLAAHAGDVDALEIRASALGLMGLHEQALAAGELVLAADPRRGEAWRRHGHVLREMGRLDEAAKAYAQALACGDDAEQNRFFLAAASGGAPPAASPTSHVATLFDGYASRFDVHLVTGLAYRGHIVLVENLPPRATPYASAVDLGCGTGLCGALLRPRAGRLIGVDLAPRMLEQARLRGVYDRLELGEAVAWLGTSGETVDLIVASDVLIYIGDLDPLFAAVRRSLSSTGVFAFSVELAGDGAADAGFVLQPTLRYAHAERYVRELASRHGFAVCHSLQAPIREDRRQPVDALYVYLAPS